MEIEATANTLHKRDRPWLDLVAWDPAGDRLVHIILTDRGANDRMDLRGQLLGCGHPIDIIANKNWVFLSADTRL